MICATIRMPSKSSVTNERGGLSTLPRGDGLVTGHAPVEPAEHEVEPSVAVEVDDVGDILPVGEDRRPARVPKGVDDAHEAGLGDGPAILPRLYHAELRLAEEIGITVVVEIGEAVPLTDLESREPVGAPLEADRGPVEPLEESDPVGRFLDEQVEVAIGVDVDELGSGDVEAAQKRMVVRPAGGIGHREARHPVLEARQRGVDGPPPAVAFQPAGGRHARRGEHGDARAG